MNNKEKTNLLYLQVLSSIGFIITISISIILTINNIQEINNKEKFFNIHKENNLSISNKTAIAIITIIFSYISYKFYILDKNNITKEEFFASILTAISALILLNTTIKSINNNINADNTIPIL